MRRHFQRIHARDPIVFSEGSRWLSMSAIYGFSLNQLLCTIQESQRSPAPDSSNCVPTVLVLHIAQQLTQAVSWLHSLASIAHGDIWDAKVMLCISHTSTEFSLPDVVLIALDNAHLDPEPKSFGGDHAATYGVIHNLGRETPECTGDDHAFFLDNKEGWDDFLEWTGDWMWKGHVEDAPRFWEFKDRLGGHMSKELGGVEKEEERRVKRLVKGAMRSEVEYLTKTQVRKALERRGEATSKRKTAISNG
jgi:hypothetical protein